MQAIDAKACRDPVGMILSGKQRLHAIVEGSETDQGGRLSANDTYVATQNARRRGVHLFWFGLVLAIATFILLWPALLNRYPILAPDSLDYIKQGRIILHNLRIPRSSITDQMTARAEIYCLVLLPLHLNRTPWLIVVFQSLITSYVLWLVLRFVFGAVRTSYYLAFIAIMSVLTTVSWFASFVMADILGGPVYLAMYLLVFAHETLSRTERVLLSLIVFLGVVSHTTHLMLAFGVCTVLAFLLITIRWKPMMNRGRYVGQLAGILAVAVVSQVLLHGYLYGPFSFSGQSPPYLMARLIADGPARTYLQQHCGEKDWVVCKRPAELPVKSDDFLWAPDGVWQSASVSERARLMKEQTPLMIATLRTYPRQQFRVSLNNWEMQFQAYHLLDFGPSWFVNLMSEPIVPGSHAAYERSHQARDTLPYKKFGDITKAVALYSLCALLILLPSAYLQHRDKLVTLAIVILPVIVANAFVCGVLSIVAARYEARIMWLIPMLTIFLLADAFQLGISRLRLRATVSN
jgi:hypothetical protein